MGIQRPHERTVGSDTALRTSTIAALVVMSMSAVPLAASGQQTPVSSPALATPGSERRIFDIPSTRAWELVQQRLKEVGLSPDKTDRASQATLTKWCEVGSQGLGWLPAPQLPETYVPRRVR